MATTQKPVGASSAPASAPVTIDAVLHDKLGGLAAQIAAMDGAGDAASPPKRVDELLQAVLAATKAANALPDPSGDRILLQNDASFQIKSKEQSDRVLALACRLIEQVNPALADSIRAEISADPTEHDGFDKCGDVVEALTEQADIALDEARGIGVNTRQVNVKQGELQTASGGAGRQVGASAAPVQRLPKPQGSFPDSIDNSRGHFVPKLTRKPHARSPLPSFTGAGPFPHPYEFEIQNLVYEPWMTSPNIEAEFAPLDAVPFRYVDTVAEFDALLEQLSHPDVKEIAIDLEAHSIHSFSGFVCLMQLSTRALDAVIDTLALRAHMHRLLDVFTDPAVVKVLHGSRMDVQWLQRDFGLYIVNLFDTGEAARVMSYPSFGLAHLLETFCRVKAQKQFQLADWRIRPIPADMLQYAREDTHYLLGIYDRMKNELIDQSSVEDGNKLQECLNKSNELALLTFDKEQYTPSSYIHTLDNIHTHLTKKQEQVFAALFEWRDGVARAEDESVHYVMPKRALLALCQHMPVNMDQLSRVCNPLPPLVRAHAQAVLKTIAEAKENPSLIPELSVPDAVKHAKTVEAIARQQQVAHLFLPVTPAVGLTSSPTVATPSPGLSGTPSPQAVLTSEQLFVMTKWTSVPEGRMVAMRGGGGGGGSELRSPLSPRDPPHGDSAVSIITPARVPMFSDAVSDDPPSESDEEGGDEGMRGSGGGGTSSGEDTEASASRIRALMGRISYASLQPVRRRRQDKHKADAAGVSGAADGPASATAAAAAVAAAPQPLLTEDILPIPKTLADIYAVSNKNRRRNKAKKRGKSGDHASGDDDGTGDDAGGDSAKEDGPSKPPVGSHIDFMRSIGWLGANDLPVDTGKLVIGGASARSQPAVDNAAAGEADSAATGPTFDYSGGGGGGGGSRAFGGDLMSAQGNHEGIAGGGRHGGRGGRGGRGGIAGNAYRAPSSSNPYMGGGKGGGGGRGGGGSGGQQAARFRPDAPRVGRGGAVFGAEKTGGFVPNRR